MISTTAIVEVLSYVKKFSGLRVLIKLGGSVLDNEKLMKQICFDLSLLRSAGIFVVLVHGGSKAINQALDTYGITSNFVDGLRVTSLEAVKVIEMVLSGQINKTLVRTLNAMGMHAVGLSGADDNILQCEYYSEVHGYVGEVKKVNANFIEEFFASQTNSVGTIPVIAPIGADAQGNALNINADWATSCIASELKVDKLIYLTDQDGICDQHGELISELTVAELEQLIADKIVKDGMLTKANSILSAINNGLDNIHIINGNREHALLHELFTDNGIGTAVKASVIASAAKQSPEYGTEIS